MATQTLQERRIQVYLDAGGVERQSPSRKYRLVELNGARLWFGRSGAVRIGATVSSSSSITHLAEARAVAATVAPEPDPHRDAAL